MFGRNNQSFLTGRPSQLNALNSNNNNFNNNHTGNVSNAELLRLQEKRRLEAVIIIQKSIRRHLAIRRVKRIGKRLWERAFDPKRRAYYWYNKRTGKSQWKVPKYCEIYRKRDLVAAGLLERVIRGFIARRRVQKRIVERYSRFYDSKLSKFYWLDKKNGKTFWKASNFLLKFDLPLAKEDQVIFDSLQKIKELEYQLQQKNEEIKEIRKKRYEELEPLVIADRVSNASKALVRSKDMDRWSVDQLCAWFVQLKMDEYIPFLFKNRVDGLLFVNLEDEEWVDMGILNKFHIRKLQLIMKAYRQRYQRKKDHITSNEEDDLMSEYAPSELSDIIASEEQGQENNNGINDSLSSDDNSDTSNEDDEERLHEGYDERKIYSIDEKQQLALDARNVRIELIVRGDGENYPIFGDIVRVRYTCMLASDGKIVQSTKNGMQKPSVEFVLGTNQLIKGIDRAIPQMSVGERAKIFISSEYAYGKEGLFPHIPPDAELIFDLTLLGFRPRVPYAKPLIQSLGQVQRPYEIPQSMVSVGGDSLESIGSFSGSGGGERGRGKMISDEDESIISDL